MTVFDVDAHERSAHLRLLRKQVAADAYHPPVDAVAERILAFLGPVCA